MTEPIVNPMFFYLISIVDELRIVCLLFAFAAVSLGITTFIYKMEYDPEDEEEEVKKGEYIKKLLRRAVIFGTFAFIGIFIPSKETMIQMEVASLATPENLNSTKEQAKNFIDYIVDSVDKLISDDDDAE